LAATATPAAARTCGRGDTSRFHRAGPDGGHRRAQRAGKRTLLKILARITEPTEGVAPVRGRVGALLEVGTAFHAELTGRENISINGALLGMSMRDIGARFDEIVEFAGVRRSSTPG
jgi:ABC-type polysaccharide/polyol phosphate transport system ATPase subunit